MGKEINGEQASAAWQCQSNGSEDTTVARTEERIGRGMNKDFVVEVYTCFYTCCWAEWLVVTTGGAVRQSDGFHGRSAAKSMERVVGLAREYDFDRRFSAFCGSGSTGELRPSE